MARKIFSPYSKRPRSNLPSKPKFIRKNGVTRIVRDDYHKQKGLGDSWYTIVKEVLDRDDYKCRHQDERGHVCLSNKDLQVHHIKPLSQGGRTEKSNLITLCESHHVSRHSHMLKD